MDEIDDDGSSPGGRCSPRPLDNRLDDAPQAEYIVVLDGPLGMVEGCGSNRQAVWAAAMVRLCDQMLMLDQAPWN